MFPFESTLQKNQITFFVFFSKLASIQCLQNSITQCPVDVGDHVSFKTYKTFNLTLSKIGHDFYELDDMFQIPSPDYVLLLHLESGSIGLTASNEEDTDCLMLGVTTGTGLGGGTFKSGHISYINENPRIKGKFLLRGEFEIFSSKGFQII